MRRAINATITTPLSRRLSPALADEQGSRELAHKLACLMFLANRSRTLALDFTQLFAHLRRMSAPISDISRPTAAFWLLFALFVGSTAPPPFLRLPSDRDLFLPSTDRARPSRRGFQPDRRPARARGDRPTRRGLIVAKTTRIRIIIQGVRHARPRPRPSCPSRGRKPTRFLKQRQGWLVRRPAHMHLQNCVGFGPPPLSAIQSNSLISTFWG